jgi:hypothetical protein
VGQWIFSAADAMPDYLLFLDEVCFVLNEDVTVTASLFGT